MDYFLSYPLGFSRTLSTSSLESRKTEWVMALSNCLELSGHRHLGSLTQ
jgi:hypothetical protein